MLKQIEAKSFRTNSLNQIARSKAITIQWYAEAQDSITLENLQNGFKKVSMDPSTLDEEMLKQYEVEDFSTLSFDVPDLEEQVQGQEVTLDT